MLSFAADLGIAPADVTQYMWICEEALAPAVLGEWQPHVDERGGVFFYSGTDGSSRWEHPLEEYYHNLYLSLKSENLHVRQVSEDDAQDGTGTQQPMPEV